jgi:predicted DNA-binding mobile mystery protein A
MQNERENPNLEELKRNLESFRAAWSLPRPTNGWIRAIRETMGVSTGELGRSLGTSRQLPLQFEKAEADDSITLKSLRRVADALDCELVYALVPRTGAMREPPTKRRRAAIAHTTDAEAETSIPQNGNHNSHFCD